MKLKYILFFILSLSCHVLIAQDQINQSQQKQFAFDLYQELATKSGNLFYSPFSISGAMVMPFAGSQGKTKTEIAEVLGFPIDHSKGIEAFKKLSTQLEEKTESGPEVNIANSIWAQIGLGMNTSFVDQMNKHYDAGLNYVDYKNKPEESRKDINTWVEDKTNNKIKDLIPKGVITPDTYLILVNAIYFLGDWLSPFDSTQTYKDEFYGVEEKVDMMSQQNYYPFYRNNKFKAIAMPYEGNEYEMIAFLPNKKDGITALEKTMTPELFNMVKKGMRSQEVSLQFPKFVINSNYSLKNHMKQVGLKTAMAGAADYSGICDRSLTIDQVLQKAFIQVDEKGTEAAAATAIVMTTESLQTPLIQSFRADHPFLFLIYHKTTDTILFMGRMENPNKDS